MRSTRIVTVSAGYTDSAAWPVPSPTPLRPPQRITLIESNRQRSRVLGESVQVPLPDGRWPVTWEVRSPRLYENYILQWEW